LNRNRLSHYLGQHFISYVEVSICISEGTFRFKKNNLSELLTSRNPDLDSTIISCNNISATLAAITIRDLFVSPSQWLRFARRLLEVEQEPYNGTREMHGGIFN
jgi:hypothetical protein